MEAFKISFNLKTTYRTNSIIYSLKSIPIIKKALPESLYANHKLKTLATVLSILHEIGTFFIGKLLYILLMVFLVSGKMKSSQSESFIHIFFFLTLIGALLNTQMFSPTKDKFYAMFLMRMDAKAYTLSNYFYFLFKTVVGFLPIIILFGLLSKVPLLICLLMPLLAVSVKTMIAAYTLYDSVKEDKADKESLHSKIAIAVVIILLACAYVLPYFGYTINEPAFLILSAISFIGSAFAFRYIMKFEKYRQVYKDILTADSIAPADAQKSAEARQHLYLNKLNVSSEQISKKSGYAYFNELFMKRHSRLLTKSAKRITMISMAIFVIALIACFAFQNIKQQVNELMLTFLPYFLFIMYLVNRGKVITEAMFMNCDHSMLTYRFYRQPKVILNLFMARLKSIVLINLMPAMVIACGLPLLLYITGGTDKPLNYVVLFVSIISMSIFFSVHNMVLYYLLQPYNVDMEIKNFTYTIINSMTYFVCYFAIGKKMPTLLFGLLITAFCIIYVMIALILAYRLAPKTFKLR